MAGPSIYDVARQRAKQQTGAAVSEQQEAIKRRFARLGGLQGGAAAKLQQRAAEKGQEQLTAAEEGISAQETQANEQKAEIEKQRSFMREERMGSQEFAKGEREAGFKFATSERMAGQDFSRGEREAQFKFADAQRLAGEAFAGAQNQAQRDWAQKQFDEQMSFQKNAQTIAQSQFAQQFEMVMRQFDLDKETTEFNKKMAENSKEGQLGKFRAGLGGKLTTKGISTGAGDIFGR